MMDHYEVDIHCGPHTQYPILLKLLILFNQQLVHILLL